VSTVVFVRLTFSLAHHGHRALISADDQLNRTFELVSADIVVPNLVARGLRTDFLVLTEIARHPDGRLQGLSQRALKACDDIMNAFTRFEGDEQGDRLVDDMLQRCREMAWQVLGRLDEGSLKKACARSPEKREARMWAMGHWYVCPLSACFSLAKLRIAI